LGGETPRRKFLASFAAKVACFLAVPCLLLPHRV
jgi:hypothetical protein